VLPNTVPNYKKHSIYIFIILLLSFSRIVPHPPNFTPIISLAIIGPFLFGSLTISLTSVILSMILSDLVIGIHSGMIQIYLIISLISIVFNRYKKSFNKINLLFYSLFGSTIFFILSNLSVWTFTNIYTKDIQGFINCYYMAIPFFANTVISTVIFSYLIFFTSIKVNEINYLK